VRKFANNQPPAQLLENWDISTWLDREEFSFPYVTAATKRELPAEGNLD
jgi:hypothetical protein